MIARLLSPLVLVLLVLLTPAFSGCARFKKPVAPPTSAPADRSPSAKLREKAPPRAAASPTSLPPPAGPVINPSASTAKTPYRLRSGDPIIIFLRDLPGGKDQQLEDIIDDAGTVNLPMIGRMMAMGKTSSEFEQEIEKKYLDDKIYLRITVNVVIPQQFVFVSGEVRNPNKFQIVSGMTLLQAITTAGGYTEYKDAKKIQLIRAGRTYLYNGVELEADPSKDVVLEAGDRIVVPRDIW